MADTDNLIVSTQARIVSRAVDTTLLDTAKQRAIDPSVFDTYSPFLWQSEISSDRLDSYYTVMDPSTTLVNYAKDANEGVAVLIGHDSRSLPVGASLTGTLGRVGDATRVLSDAYALIEPSTESIINRVKAGIARDVSVGFAMKGAQCLCSICGLDMWRDWDCWHIPGFEYEVTTEATNGGVAAKTMVLCTGRIVNAHLSEYSLVYDGATPGAAVLQAQRAAEAGRISPQQARLIEQRYRIHLPQRAVQGVGATLQKDKPMPPEPTKETDRSADDASPAATTPVLERELLPLLAEAGAPADRLLPDQVRWLIEDRKRLIPLADDGKAYRTDLMEETLAEGVRAFGDGFSEETYRAVLQTAPLTTVKRMRDDWAGIAKLRFPAGRKTEDTNEDEAPSVAEEPAAPAYLYSS